MAGCSVHPTRIDFNFNPPPPLREEGEPSFALIEDTSQLDSELRRLVDFLDASAVTNSVSRVGLFLHFLTLGPDLASANGILSGIIPDRYRISLAEEEDFILQINRPRTSTSVAGLKMNCITKWSVDRFQVINILIAAATPVDPRVVSSPQGREFVASSLVSDVNNAPTNASLSGHQQSLLLAESLEIAKQMQRESGLKVEGF